MTRKISFLVVVIVLFGVAGVKAQNLDRISLSSGGAATDEVNYVLGETFNFTMADGATVILETGTLGSTDDTGGDNNFTIVQQIAEHSPLECYPNPTTSILNLKIGDLQQENVVIAIYDISGKIVNIQSCKSANVQQIDVNNLVSGTYFISVSDSKFNLIGSTKFIKQ